jgi:hypothetical protein
MNELKIKVFKGTRSASSARLCDSCSSGLITRGAMDSDEGVFCNWTQRPVNRRVVECNRYQNSSEPSLYFLEQIAWVLRTDSKRQKVGFVSASEWRRKNPDENLLP